MDFLWIARVPSKVDIDLRNQLVMDYADPRFRQIHQTIAVEILFAPDQTRDVGDNILLKRTSRSEFGNQFVVEFLEFAWVSRGRRAVPAFRSTPRVSGRDEYS